MIKFLMRNKLQFLTVIGTNLIVFLIIILMYVINIKTLTDLEAVFLGLFYTYFSIIYIKKFDKKIRLRLILVSLIYIFGLRYISTFILDPEEVLTIQGIIIGFLIYVYIWNTADTIHKIRMKSRLVLTDLDTK